MSKKTRLKHKHEDSYITFLESQLEKVSAACLSVSNTRTTINGFSENLSDFKLSLSEQDAKLANVTKLVGMLQAMHDRSHLDEQIVLENLQYNISTITTQVNNNAAAKEEMGRLFQVAIQQMETRADERCKKLLAAQRDEYEQKLNALETQLADTQADHAATLAIVTQRLDALDARAHASDRATGLRVDNLKQVRANDRLLVDEMSQKIVQLAEKDVLQSEKIEKLHDDVIASHSDKLTSMVQEIKTLQEQSQTNANNVDELRVETQDIGQVCARIARDMVARVDAHQKLQSSQITTLEDDMRREIAQSGESLQQFQSQLLKILSMRRELKIYDAESLVVPAQNNDDMVISSSSSSDAESEPTSVRDDAETIEETIINLEQLMESMQCIEQSLSQNVSSTRKKPKKQATSQATTVQRWQR